ncbi:MAG: phosphate-starvation-inducible PsiE family protein [Oscillatoriophycideae cyanobacterium NC_groundwater_1537_Pr4_S-0.65um_50_18]|nr:phosphate-starvation-inducible PsiE family protein [Oscillatoriophycideae cyanobacterium NC_groundwater_1537_Pr4_S-0.65um_50_18]
MGVKKVETLAAKVMSIAMVVIILVAVAELCLFIGQEILFSNALVDPDRFSTVTLIKVFGLFLNVLIALEVMENITAYLKKHGVQLELVIVTSLTAVARKIIIFDFSKSSGNELMALAIAILTLSLSYWIVRRGAH